MMNFIKNKYLTVSQPIGEFICCVMKASDLYKISFSDIRRLESEQNDDGIDSYLGIQRELNPSRVKKIAEYISSVDATFPNSIIVAIDEKYISLDNDFITIAFDDERKGKIAKILDGQHRLAGFNDSNFCFISADGDEIDFEVLVTIFVETDLHTQAQVFTMVNQNQTKVNKSLVYDLESLALARNPSKTAHQIAIALNSNKSSPFYKRIKRLGIKTKGINSELLTQAAFVDNVIKLISRRPSLDRDILLGKKKNFVGLRNKKLPNNDTSSFRLLPFRLSFINNNDAFIAANVYNYFSAVNNRWPKSWSHLNKESTLNKTVGFIALVRFLRDIINHVIDNDEVKYGDVISYEVYYAILEKIKLEDDFFSGLDSVSKTAGYIYKELKSFM